MIVNELMKQKNISMYRLSKNSGIPYTTINDICSGKAQLEKCSAETVYKLSKEFDISMEDLLSPYIDNRISFELYKSNVCHQLKELGDIDFIIETLQTDNISKYYKKRWYAECFYLLAMLDYICRENNVPTVSEYNHLRAKKLTKPLFPSSILTACMVSKSSQPKTEALMYAIPEFKRFNIIENEVRNVV